MNDTGKKMKKWHPHQSPWHILWLLSCSSDVQIHRLLKEADTWRICFDYPDSEIAHVSLIGSTVISVLSSKTSSCREKKDKWNWQPKSCSNVLQAAPMVDTSDIFMRRSDSFSSPGRVWYFGDKLYAKVGGEAQWWVCCYRSCGTLQFLCHGWLQFAPTNAHLLGPGQQCAYLATLPIVPRDSWPSPVLLDFDFSLSSPVTQKISDQQYHHCCWTANKAAAPEMPAASILPVIWMHRFHVIILLFQSLISMSDMKSLTFSLL